MLIVLFIYRPDEEARNRLFRIVKNTEIIYESLVVRDDAKDTEYSSITIAKFNRINSSKSSKNSAINL